MLLDPHETHDRFVYFVNKDFEIPDAAQDLINQRPFGNHPFYIFCHTRTDDDGYRKRFISSPWIVKPRAQTNTMLIKAYPGTDIVKWMWILPERHLWLNYTKGMLFENEFVTQCTKTFDENKHLLEQPEPDDPTPEKTQEIVFEYQPQLFRRETLPEEKKHIWDRKMIERNKQRDLARQIMDKDKVVLQRLANE